MASFVQRVGQNFSGAGTSLVVSVAAASAAGRNLLVWIRAGAFTAAPSSVVDSKSNTYALEYAATSSNGNWVYRSDLTTALTTSDTITVTFAASQSAVIAAIADLFTGLGTHDVAADSTHTSAATMAQAITALADDALIYACYAYSFGGGTVGVNSPFTATGASTGQTGTTTGATILTAYDPSPAAGTITATFTDSPAAHSGTVAVLAYPVRPAAGGLLMSCFP
jgi:hypothetical protein